MTNNSAADDAKRIRRGIAAYEKQQQCLLDVLAERGSLTASEFDAEFDSLARDANGRTIRKAPRFAWFAVDGDSFVLAPMQCNERAKMIHLAQFMAALGDIEIVNEGGTIVYRLPQAEVPA